MNIKVINRSQRFFTIKNILSQFWDHLFYFEPDIIILQVGVVDCWFRKKLNGRQKVNINDFEKYYNRLIEMLNRKNNTKMIIIGICPTSERMEQKHPGILREIKKYNKVLKNKIDNNKLFYVDMENYIDPNEPHKYLHYDDHHLNKEGNKIVSQNIIRRVKAIIEHEIGVESYYKKEKIRQAYNHFLNSFNIYPFFIDNIYNLSFLAGLLNESKVLKKTTLFVKNNNIKNQELIDLLSKSNKKK